MASVDRQADHLRTVEVGHLNANQPGTSTAKNPYPATYFPYKTAQERLQLLSDAGRVADNIGLQKPSFDNALIELAQQKKKEVELYNFEGWIENQYNQNDPAENKILAEIYPDFTSKRVQFVEEKYELAKRFDLLKLRGPQNKDDLVLMYMVANGLIDIPTIDWNKTKTADDDSIRRGLLSVRKWVTPGKDTTPVLNGAGALWAPTNKTVKNFQMDTANGVGYPMAGLASLMK